MPTIDHSKGNEVRYPLHTIICSLIVVTVASIAQAQISLEWDFDHGALNLANTTITDTQITLGPRDDIYYSRWIYCKATGIVGLNPEFRISNVYPAGSTLGNYHRYVYSYDQQTWNFFDNGENSGGYYRFNNDTAFTQDTVWLAYALPYPLSATEDHLAQVITSPYVSPTPSADSNFVIGLSNDGTLTDLGRTVPQHDIYAFKISDDSVAGPKTVVVLTTGNHPNETTGTYVFQGLVDFLLSDDPRAAALRAAADFYVYPESNPDGRWAGHSRSNPENPNTDHNRYWNNPVGFTDITVVTTAMKADTNSQADYFFDFHSYNQATNYGIWMYPEHVESNFTQSLVSREPAIQVMTATVADDGPGVSRHWAHLPEGLNAEFTFTPESGFIADWYPSRLFQLGTSYGLALHDAIVTAGCNEVNTNGFEVFQDDFDNAASADNWTLLSSSSDYTAEFAFDYSVHGIPAAPRSTTTTTGLKLTVNNNDGNPTTEAVNLFPADLVLDGNYALSFDMWINYNGGAGGGTGSTEFFIAGLGHSATELVWPSNANADGYWFATTGEGGAMQDYRAYDGPDMLALSSGAYPAGSQNQTASYYQSAFPSPEYETAGVPGKHWVEAELQLIDGTLKWSINDIEMAVIQGVPDQPATVMIGYMDIFSSVASPAADNFVIYDNVRVEQLPEQDCNANAIPDACETFAFGDFNNDGIIDLGDYSALADCLAGTGQAPDPAEPTCVHLCLTIFDADGDNDVDLRDFAYWTTNF